MEIDRTLLLRGVAAFLAIAGIWTAFEVAPGRRLVRCQERLLEAAGNRNWETVRTFLAEEYRDHWGNDRDQAITQASEALRNFLTLEITSESTTVQREGREATISARLRLAGRGNAIGEEILSRANSLESHFQFAWKRKSWKPWDWKLVFISQPELDTTWTP